MYKLAFLVIMLAAMVSGEYHTCTDDSDCEKLPGLECGMFTTTSGNTDKYSNLCVNPDQCGQSVTITFYDGTHTGVWKCGFSAFWFVNSHWLIWVIISLVLLIVRICIRM